MNTLVRNPTSISRRFNGYEPLDQRPFEDTSDQDYQWRRNFSRRRKDPNYSMVKSFSYRRTRAKQRQIFLKSYTLSSENLGQSNSRSSKLKKAVITMKAMAVSVVAFMSMDSLRSCNSRAAIDASSPTMDNVQASNDPPPYHPKYVMLNNEQTTGNLRPPPQRRNPPRYNSQHPSLQSSSSGNGCLKCICCCYCCLFSLIVILTIVALNTEVTAFVKADNPNSHIGFKYGKDSSVIVNYKGTTLCSGKLPAFSQPNDNITTFSVGLRGQTEVGSALQESLMADKKAGKIPLLVTIKAPVVVVLGSFPLREVVASIHCSLVVDNLAPDKPINILSSKYDYDVSF
ncbi:hypothetical protein Pint_02214 [Pistacia integerrima]|uniref:Uncharacterized protein n=1 Tax=Pistacia integerrima TaxID=434235 RepID=A0ACC0ZKL1_9ROSI|nr:hypothetical protein Pint_02214 [Pistacia integerrima]